LAIFHDPILRGFNRTDSSDLFFVLPYPILRALIGQTHVLNYVEMYICK